MTSRKLLNQKLESWSEVRQDQPPPSGWLKAVRSALGMNTRQLAERLGIRHSAVVQLEKREAEGKVSLETLAKAARAMNCKLVYAIVPDEPFSSLEDIVEDQAQSMAKAIIQKVDHTMRLEKQGLNPERMGERIQELATQIKSEMGSRFWNSSVSSNPKKPSDG